MHIVLLRGEVFHFLFIYLSFFLGGCYSLFCFHFLIDFFTALVWLDSIALDTNILLCFPGIFDLFYMYYKKISRCHHMTYSMMTPLISYL
jgi:hypothetical protein